VLQSELLELATRNKKATYKVSGFSKRLKWARYKIT
jgi:hypothetical protein